MSPFEVRAEHDRGYVATNTLAGSRLNTSLANTPASISVMTKEFLDDIGAISVTGAMEYSLNASNDINGGNTSNRGDTGNGLIANDFNFQVRGYRNATQTRDYFQTLLDGDAYNIERIDVARGPNSLLFGVGGPSGVINTTTKRANPNRTFGELNLRYGSYDAKRSTLDYNQALLDGKLGARMNLLYQRADGYHDFESNNQQRGALALTWRPTDSTTVRLQGEAGFLHQNRVRPWTAVDNFSHWADVGRPMVPFGTPQSPAGYLASGTGGTNLGPTLPPLVALDQNYSQAQNTSSVGGPNNGLPALTDSTGIGEFRTFHTGFYNLFMDGPLAGHTVFLGGDPSLGGSVGSFRGARYYRSSNGYGNQSGFDTPFPVRDDRIFPRTGNISGPGQYVEIHYKVLGATIEQRVGRDLYLEFSANRTTRGALNRTTLAFSQISVVYDAVSALPTFRDDYTFAASLGGPTTTGQGRGALNFLPTYTNLLTGAVVANPRGGGLVANPNAGAMLVSYNPSYSESETTLDDLRLSATYHLDLGRAGDHHLLAFVARSESDGDFQNFAIGNLDPQRTAQNVSTNVPVRIRHVDPVSGNLADRGIPDPWQDPLPNRVVYGVASVVPGQPSVTEYFTPGFYRSNWSGSLRRTDSAAIAAHSSFLKNTLVTTIGGRRDRIQVWNDFVNTNAANGPVDRDPATQIVNSVTAGQTPSVNVGGNTYSMGAVYHLPVKRLEWLSLFANKSTNFQDQSNALRFEDEAVRPSLEIGPLKGIGRDFGVKAALLDGRINATVTRFTVDQENVAVGVGSSNVTNYINAIWTTIQNNGPDTVQADTDNPSGHHIGGSDTRSQTAKGWELEVTANPTRDWRVSFNLSKSDNVVSKLGSSLTAYIEKHRAEWQSKSALSYDTSRNPGFVSNAGGTNTIGALLYGLDNIFVPFAKANEGLSEINIRPWNANLFTSYHFSSCWIKGLTLGGGVNYRGPEILGIKPATVTDPKYQVFNGSIYYLVNAMAAYEFRLHKKYNAKLQLNVNNLLNFDDLQVLSSNYNPTTQTIGKWYYHLEPRTYSLSLRLGF